MQTWFECKVKYLKIDQGGYERKVNDNYLIDAVSFTDAETRVFQQMQEITSGEFQVMNIKKSNITEVIPGEDGEWWYKAKISLVTIDEEKGKEKKLNNYILIMADDLNQSLARLEQGLSYMLVPYVVTSVQLSTIAEVFPYDEETESKIVNRPEPEPQPEEYPEEDKDNNELDPIEDIDELESIDEKDESNEDL